jgi:hypothetical protein
MDCTDSKTSSPEWNPTDGDHRCPLGRAGRAITS